MSTNVNPTRRPGRGFTLIELIVTVIILGVLASVAAVAYSGFVNDSRNASIAASAHMIADSVQAAAAEADVGPSYYVENNWNSGDPGGLLDTLGINGEITSVFQPATGTQPATLRVESGNRYATITLPDDPGQAPQVISSGADTLGYILGNTVNTTPVNIDAGSGTTDVHFSPDGHLMAAISTTTAIVYTVSTDNTVTPASTVNPGGTSPDLAMGGGHLMAIASHSDPTSPLYKVSDSGSANYTDSANTSNSHSEDVALSPDGDTLAITGHGSYLLTLFSVSPAGTASYAGRYSLNNPTDVQFSPDGDLMVVTDSGWDRVITYTVTATGDVTRADTASITNPQAAAFTPDGKHLAAVNATNNDVTMYAVTASGDLTPVGTWNTGNSPESVAFNPAGNLMAVANISSDTVSLYTVASDGTATPDGTVNTGNAPNGVSFSPNGTLMAVAVNGPGIVSLYTVS